MITVFSDSRYKIHSKKVKTQTQDYMTERGIYGDYDISLVFIGKRKMKSIAREYKKEDVALPILSFLYRNDLPDMQEGTQKPMGELFICYPQAVLLAAQKEKGVYIMLQELIEHGIDTIIA